MTGRWGVAHASQSLRKLGAPTYSTERIVIPETFRDTVNQAKAEYRSIRVQYRPVLGTQIADSVQII